MDIKVTMTAARGLTVPAINIGAVGDNLSRTLAITVPPDLAAYQCRVEFEDPGGTSHFLYAENFRLPLPGEWMERDGNGILQIVMVDPSGEVVAKSAGASVTISPSVNAVDETDPVFADGLSRVRGAAFAALCGLSSFLAHFVGRSVFRRRRTGWPSRGPFLWADMP